MHNTHYIVHAHGNNHKKAKVKWGHMPQVIELTYVNKRFFNDPPKCNQNSFPIKGLDFKNGRKNIPDIVLDFYPFVSKI